MATISVTHQSVQNNINNKASRRRSSTTFQTNKHREDIALANYMSPKVHPNRQTDLAHAMTGYPFVAPNVHGGAYAASAEWAAYYQQYHQTMQQQQQQQQQTAPYYYVPSSYQHSCYQQPYHTNNHGTWADQSQPLKPQRSSSTPVPRPSTSSRPTSRLGNNSSNMSPRNNPLYYSHQQHQQHYYHDPRPSRTSSSSSSTVSTTSCSDFSTGRRSSVTSMASSIVSEVSSVNSKRTISRRLRDVFKGTPSPTPSLSATKTIAGQQQKSPQRRSSIRAFSNLFQKNNIVPTVVEEEAEEETTVAEELHHGSSVISSTSSTSTAIAEQDETNEKITSAAAAAATTTAASPKRIQFYPTIQVHETFSSGEYDRRCDAEATCQKLTPLMGIKIKQELNEYKLTDMQVHVESRRYTHFLL